MCCKIARKYAFGDIHAVNGPTSKPNFFQSRIHLNFNCGDCVIFFNEKTGSFSGISVLGVYRSSPFAYGNYQRVL
jgi:hypothetical protein